MSTLCHSCGFACQQRVLKTFPDPGYLHSQDGGSLTMAFTGKFVCIYMCVCVCVCVCVCIYICMYVCMYVLKTFIE